MSMLLQLFTKRTKAVLFTRLLLSTNIYLQTQQDAHYYDDF